MDTDSNIEQERVQPLTLDAWVRRMSADGIDVRIHDSAQAGELVRRLGARAFTAGKDVYIRPELVRPMSREGAAVLAHELYHVAEQSGRPAPLMPLAPAPGRPQGMSQTGQTTGAQAIQRQVGSTVPVQRAEGTTSASERGAEHHEDATRNEGRRRRQRPPDPQVVADRVYDLMSHELRLDSERRSFGR